MFKLVVNIYHSPNLLVSTQQHMGLYLLSYYLNIIRIVGAPAVKIYIFIYIYVYISDCKGEVCLGGLKLKCPTSPCTKDLSWHFTYPGPSIRPQIISRLVLCVSARMEGIIRVIMLCRKRSSSR